MGSKANGWYYHLGFEKSNLIILEHLSDSTFNCRDSSQFSYLFFLAQKMDSPQSGSLTRLVFCGLHQYIMVPSPLWPF